MYSKGQDVFRTVLVRRFLFTILNILLLLNSTVNARQYTYLSYSQIIQRMGQMNAQDKYNIIDIEEVQNLTTASCVADGGSNEPCRFTSMKITNFNKTSEEIARLPQVLMIAGFFGKDRIGSTSILEFAEDILLNVESFRPILNSIMLILVPIANPIGFSRGESTENGITTATDFPLYYSENLPTGNCFSTSSSRFVNEIIRNSLISTAFVISASSTDLTKLSKVKLTQAIRSLSSMSLKRVTILTGNGL